MTGARTTGGDAAGLAVVDPHAHYYAAYGATAFLDAAWSNLSAAAQSSGLSLGGRPEYAAVLLDIRDGGNFTAWRDGTIDVDGWERSSLPDDSSAVRYADAAGRRLLLVGGRQLVSAEGLEVLVIGTADAIADGLPVREYLRRYGSLLPVMLPWGVGKWLGRRGRLIRALLEESDLPPFLLGDNAGRPWLWSGGWPFRRAAELGISVLPGSDPLPIRRHVDRIGRCGCVFEVDLSGAHPGRALATALRELGSHARCFGRQSGIGEFVRDQLTLRLDRVA